MEPEEKGSSGTSGSGSPGTEEPVIRIQPLSEAGIPWSSRLHTRLLLTFGLTTLIIGSVTLVFLRERFAREAELSTSAQLRLTQRAFVNLLETQYLHLESTSQLIADAPRIAAVITTDDAPTVQAELEDFQRHGRIDRLLVVSVGRVLLGDHDAVSPAPERPAVATLPGIDAALEGRMARGLMRAGAELLMTVAVPVRRGEESVGALVVGSRIDDDLARSIQGLSQVDVAFLADGQLMATSLPESSHEFLPKIAELVVKPGSIRQVEIEGRPLLTLRGLFQPGDESVPLSYQLLLDMTPALDKLRTFENVMITGSFFFVLTLIVIVNYLSARITGGLKVLVEAASEIARGNFTPVLDVSTDDEVGYLARMMQELSRSVGKRVHGLQRINAKLRGKIEDILFNETLGEQYTDVDILGRGGMGIVYRAYDKVREKQVAIKILSPLLAEETEMVKRFLREGEILAKLQHPGVIQVYATGHTKLPFCVMEFFPGVSLKAVVAERGPRPWPEAAEILMKILRVLHYLHEHGVMHRDVKPANILLDTGGDIRLVDFGLAHDRQMTQMTQTGEFFGTIVYAPPELYEGGTHTVKGEVFSAGMTLYYLLTGGVVEELRTRQDALLPSSGGFPQELEDVLRKALSVDPAKRYATCLEFHEALAGLSAGAEPAVTPAAPAAAGA